MPALPNAVLADFSDTVRSGILADLPEIMDIGDALLREQVIAAWALSLHSHDGQISRSYEKWMGEPLKDLPSF